MNSSDQLRRQLVRTLKARNIDSGLAANNALHAIEPRDPARPKRAARLSRSAGLIASGN